MPHGEEERPAFTPRAKAPEKEGIAASFHTGEMHEARAVRAARALPSGGKSRDCGAHRSPLRGPNSEFADPNSHGRGCGNGENERRCIHGAETVASAGKLQSCFVKGREALP